MSGLLFNSWLTLNFVRPVTFRPYQHKSAISSSRRTSWCKCCFPEMLLDHFNGKKKKILLLTNGTFKISAQEYFFSFWAKKDRNVIQSIKRTEFGIKNDPVTKFCGLCHKNWLQIWTQSYKNIFSVDLRYPGILTLWMAKIGHVTFISQ